MEPYILAEFLEVYEDKAKVLKGFVFVLIRDWYHPKLSLG